MCRLGCLLNAQSVHFFNAQRGKVFVVAAAQVSYPRELTIFETECDVQMVHVLVGMNEDFMRRKALRYCFEHRFLANRSKSASAVGRFVMTPTIGFLASLAKFPNSRSNPKLANFLAV